MKQKRKDIPYWREYNMQKNMATSRGIDWKLTFERWKEWWGDDIDKRGRHPGDLVMGRIDTTKPYAIDNLIKLTHAENVQRATRGVPTAKTRPCRTPLGDFVSVAEASRAHGHANPTTINRRLLRGDEGFKYLDE